MIINNVQFNADTLDILNKVQNETHGTYLKTIKPINGYVMVTCPFHKNGQERTPSAEISTKDGTFWCFSCRQYHTLPEVISKCLNTNGWAWLINNFTSENIESRHFELNMPTKIPPKYIDPAVLLQYRTKHPYMYTRKLTDKIIEQFDIGYDKQQNAITFPVKDKLGHILFIATRQVDKKRFHYPLGATKPLYGEFELRQEQKHENITEVYVVESMLDALAIWSWGKYAIALNGVGSATQYQQLRELPVRTLILATDNDEAGKRARDEIKRHVHNKFIKELDYASYDTCKDINDMSREQFLSANIVGGFDANRQK